MMATATESSSSSSNSSTLSLEGELPSSQALSAVLSSEFCSGKTISTFFLIVARSNHRLRPGATSLCRGILVHRFIELANNFVGEPDVKDVIDAIREDCRLSSQQDEDHGEDHVDDLSRSSISIVTKLSEWCAILDYFEIHLRVAKEKMNNSNISDMLHHPLLWIVWTGTWQIPYGETRGYLSSSTWTAGAMQYWRNRELMHLSWTYPRGGTLSRITLPFYAMFMALDNDDDRRLRLQSGSLEDRRTHVHDDEGEGAAGLLARHHFLVPADEVYDVNPTMALGRRKRTIVRNQAQDDDDLMSSFLECYWESQDGEEGDWEEVVSRLGESVIRIMNMTSSVHVEGGRGFEFYVKSAYDNWRL
jgi:hypothetical protein